MNPYSESYKLLSPHYIRGMSPFTYYGTWDGKSLKLDISGVNVIAKGYDPYELAANMQRELERAFKESAELKRIGGLLPWLAPMDRGMNRTEDPIRTKATTAAGIADVVVEWVTGRILELIGGEKSLREAEEYLDQRDAAWMWYQIHKPIRPMAGIAEAFAARKEMAELARDPNEDRAADYIRLGDALGLERDWLDREVIEGLRQGRRAELEEAGVGPVKTELSGGEASKGAVPCMPEPAIDMPPLPPGTPICPREEKPDERPWFRQQLDGTELGDFLDAVDDAKALTEGFIDGGAKYGVETVCSGFVLLRDLNPFFISMNFWAGRDVSSSRQTVDFFASGYFLEAFPLELQRAMLKVNQAKNPRERGEALAELMALTAGLFATAYAAGKPGLKSSRRPPLISKESKFSLKNDPFAITEELAESAVAKSRYRNMIGRVIEIDPRVLRKSQTTVSFAKIREGADGVVRVVDTLDHMKERLRKKGWPKKQPLDVVIMPPDGELTTLDHTRLRAVFELAEEQGTQPMKITVRVHNPWTPLYYDERVRFMKKEVYPETWGEAARLRTNTQGKIPPDQVYGLEALPRVTGRPNK